MVESAPSLRGRAGGRGQFLTMAQRKTNQQGILASLDWVTIAIYLVLLVFGWISVCGASYNYGDEDIFSMSTRSGMQIMWIGTSICLGFIILMTDDRLYDTFSYVIYGLMMLLLFATIFNPHEIKGSRSWIVMGPLRIQPAEFIIFPMLLIIGQKETGSALVYSAFFLMLYREGMSGSFLFTGVAMIIYFIVGIRFADVQLWDMPASVGKFSVLLMVQIFTSALIEIYCHDRQRALIVLYTTLGITLGAVLFSEYVIPFDIVWVQLALSAIVIIYLIYIAMEWRIKEYFFIALFTVGSIAFFYSADYVLNNVMQAHQRVRINVLLGLEEDLAGAGYNVHQSEIAIGSAQRNTDKAQVRARTGHRLHLLYRRRRRGFRGLCGRSAIVSRP